MLGNPHPLRAARRLLLFLFLAPTRWDSNGDAHGALDSLELSAFHAGHDVFHAVDAARPAFTQQQCIGDTVKHELWARALAGGNDEESGGGRCEANGNDWNGRHY